MKFYLSKKRNNDGTPLKNPERVNCTILFGFDLKTQETLARAIVNNVEIATLHNAQITEMNKIGLYFKGLEKVNNAIYYQEWFCGYDDNSHENLVDMEMTQSHLFEGM